MNNGKNLDNGIWERFSIPPTQTDVQGNGRQKIISNESRQKC